MLSETATVVPDRVVWWVRPGDTTAHAFSTGPGWMRSACRQARWSAAVQEPGDGAIHCSECDELVDGAQS